MADDSGFDFEKAHKHFSAHCFDMAWELIDKADRTTDDDEQMIRLAQAALWHWMQRPDCADKNLSIGYWQVSRIYALLGQRDNARRYAELCLEITPENEPFFLGYAYEALARAESIAENDKIAKDHLAKAWQYAEEVTEAEDKQLLVDDLRSL